MIFYNELKRIARIKVTLILLRKAQAQAEHSSLLTLHFAAGNKNHRLTRLNRLFMDNYMVIRVMEEHLAIVSTLYKDLFCTFAPKIR